MNVVRITFLAAALSSLGGAALAQPNAAPNEVPENEAYQREHRWEAYRGPYDRRWFLEREQDYYQRGLRGAGPERDLRIGQRLSPAWRSRQYAVEDWQRHRLIGPPQGYSWYQVGADYALVNNANGVIVQLQLAR